MNRPPPGAPGDRLPGSPWYQGRPGPDDPTRVARALPRATQPPPPSRPPDIPWYLQRPDRPVPAPPREQPRQQREPVKVDAAWDFTRHLPWLLVGVSGLAVLIGAAVLIVDVTRPGVDTGSTVLDVTTVQAGVTQILSDPAGGYGANAVSDVSCNGGRNPSAGKGTTFFCDAIVNGASRRVDVLVADDRGTYEIDSPR